MYEEIKATNSQMLCATPRFIQPGVAKNHEFYENQKFVFLKMNKKLQNLKKYLNCNFFKIPVLSVYNARTSSCCEDGLVVPIGAC